MKKHCLRGYEWWVHGGLVFLATCLVMYIDVKIGSPNTVFFYQIIFLLLCILINQKYLMEKLKSHK